MNTATALNAGGVS